MSSDSDINEFEYDVDVHDDNMSESDSGITIDESIKDNLYILHRGHPSTKKSKFSNTTDEATMKENIYKHGLMVYNIANPNLCLNPAIRDTDTILRFDSHFESGNLAEVYHVSENVYNCILEYDRNTEGSCQWFYFKVMNARKNTKYTFYISGFHKKKSLYTSGAKIFWYSELRAQISDISWTRGGENYAYGVLPGQKSRIKKRYTVSFDITFPYNNDTIYLCYALPYTYSDLQRDIEGWKKLSPYLMCETLCDTLGGRECPILSLTEPNQHLKDEDKSCIFVTARIHPGESNGSFLMRGFMNALLDNSSISSFLRKNYIFKIIPMLNIDGVIEGFYRVSLSGDDLNRIWSDPDEGLHPVILAAKTEISKIAAERKIEMFIDFHGHSRSHGTFAFGCPNDGSNIQDIEKIYPRILCLTNDAFSWHNCEFSLPTDRKSAARIVVRTEMNVAQSFTIETSFGGIIAGPRAGILYDQTIWEELGQTCCTAINAMAKTDSDDNYQKAMNDVESMSQSPQPDDTKMFDDLRISSSCMPPLINAKLEDLYTAKSVTTYFSATADDIKTEKPRKITLRYSGFPSNMSDLV